VWLSKEAWQEAVHALQPAEQKVCQEWEAARWPLVVRRQIAAPGQVGVGLALPPNSATGQKSKISLSCDLNGIVRQQSPLLLRQALGAAPDAWKPGLAALDAALAEHGMECAVYGSLAWQSMTGQEYLHGDSDIDVSVPLQSVAQLEAAGHALQAAKLPLDGELLFPMQQAVAWKEWFLTDSERVLVKQEQAYLCPRQRLLECLA
jgi:phosphoribosyl-dephospho-CoA transferase